jgi:diguanylate cyclase (GGDEF)-like protein
MSATGIWSTQQLAEFLTGIASCKTEAEATQHAVEHAAEALEAEVCIYVRDGEIIDSVGFPPGAPDPDSVAAVVERAAVTLEVPGLGSCPTMAVPVVGMIGGDLVVGRADNNFEPGERSLVRAMGRALSLTIGAIHTLEAERERRELLSRLSRIQRSISHHAPLQQVLDAISDGASELLGEPVAALTMLDPENPDQLITRSIVGIEPDEVERMRCKPIGTGTASRAIEQDDLTVIEGYQQADGTHSFWVEWGVQASLGAPVREAGTVVGALVVASTKPGRHFTEAEREALTAFADHASLALTDARLTDQVDRAMHDPLTGLPNRSFLGERVAERLAAGTEVALISLDLDKFRTVNDRIGHRAADGLLIEFSKRLQSLAGSDGLVARLEGDAFALLCEPVLAPALADDLIRAVAEPFDIDGRAFRTTVSVGIVTSGDDPDQMIRDADLAMYRAKSEGGSRVVQFEPGMHAELVKRLELQDDLARALEEGEVEAHFQPKVDLRNARVIGVEALVRWNHPERGLIAPGEFLDLAEAGGHMRALTERVIEFSTRAAGDWWHSGLGLQLSVNLAGSLFSEPEWRIDEFVKRALARTGLPGKALQFEVTEDALMTDSETASEVLTRLSDLGATIAIDDFGTGHSSLGRLKSLPIDELKIDRSFVRDLTDEEDKTIVRSTIHLAHQMGLQVVAEGVETEEAWRQLRSMGCERAQGFLIAKPLPAREVPAWLASWNQQARQLSSAGSARRRTKIATTEKTPEKAPA